MIRGIRTDAQRDQVLVNHAVESDVLEAIIVFLLIHLARKEPDPTAFLRALSEDLRRVGSDPIRRD